MKRIVIAIFIISLIVIANLFHYVQLNYYESKQTALNAAIKKNAPELLKRDYRVINVPNSSYILCLTVVPHSLYVFETSSHFHKYKSSLLTVDNLYAGDGAGVHYVNDRFVYGFDKEKPKDKDIYIDHKKMNVIELGKFFKDSKYEIIYRNLVLYYPVDL